LYNKVLIYTKDNKRQEQHIYWLCER